MSQRRSDRFAALFADVYGDVVRFAQRRTAVSVAEDVAAETFLVAWRRFDEVPSGRGEARAWLFVVARNHMLNLVRGQDRRDALAVRIAHTPSVQPPGSPDLDAAVMRCDFAAAWRRLSAAEQEVLALTVFDGLASAQAARVLGVSPTAYRLRLMRARRALRNHLDITDPRPTADSLLPETTP